jgi:hypothetical protein
VYASQHEKSSCFYVSRVVSLSLIICLMLTFTYICFSDDICFLSNMMMINSPPAPSSQAKTQSDSAKRLRLTIPRNNKTDLLNNSPSKIDEKNNHLQQKSIDCNNTMTTMKQQLSTSIDNENDTTLLTTTTTTTTVEVKVKTTKTSSSSSSSSRKRKLNVVDETINTTNNNNNDNISKQQQQQAVSKKKKKPRPTNNDTITNNESLKNDSNHQTHPKTVDQSSVTDESSFGSCEPGTSVVLEGIVWNETDKGVLVVNITWRGKTYVGALLNTTEQNWAPPRYKSDVRTSKHNRHNHHHNNNNNNNSNNHNRDYLLSSTPSSSSAVHLQSNTNHSSNEPAERILRNGKRRGTYTTVTPSATTKSNSFKIPEAPPSKTDEILNAEKLNDTGSGALSSSSTSVNDEDDTNSISGEKTLVRNGVDDETGDNCSSRSVSPTTSGASTTSSSPPPLIQEKSIVSSATTNNNSEQSVASIPIDLSNSRTTIKMEENSSPFNSILQTSSPSKSSLPPSFLSSFTNKTSKSKTKEPLSTPPSLLSPHPFNNGMLFSPPTNPSSYFPPPPPPFLHGPPNSFGLSPFHPASLHSNTNKSKLSPTSSSTSLSPSSYLSIPPQLYYNPLTTPRFPSVCSSPSSLSKSSR